MLRPHRGSVALSPNGEDWDQFFVDERDRILNGISDPSLAVELIGSTSIDGIAAKPILDI